MVICYYSSKRLRRFHSYLVFPLNMMYNIRYANIGILFLHLYDYVVLRRKMILQYPLHHSW